MKSRYQFFRHDPFFQYDECSLETEEIYFDQSEIHDLQLFKKFHQNTFYVFSHVVINDHRYVLNIDTTTGDIRSHQYIFGTIFQAGQGVLSLLLSFTTVQRARVVL